MNRNSEFRRQFARYNSEKYARSSINELPIYALPILKGAPYISLTNEKALRSRFGKLHKAYLDRPEGLFVRGPALQEPSERFPVIQSYGVLVADGVTVGVRVSVGVGVGEGGGVKIGNEEVL